MRPPRLDIRPMMLFALLALALPQCTKAGSPMGLATIKHISYAPSPYGYAPSPITQFADEVTSLAFAAVAGKPLPKVSFPHWAGGRGWGSSSRPAKGRRVTREVHFSAQEGNIIKHMTTRTNNSLPVKSKKVMGRVNFGQVRGLKLTPPLRALGFFVEVDVVLIPRARGGWRRDRPELSMDETILYLNQKGLKVGRYNIKEGDAWPAALPPTLRKLGHVYRPILASVRNREKPANLLTGEEILDLGRWAGRRFKIPNLDTRARYHQRLLKFKGEQPVGYQLGHINIFVIDSKAKTAYLRLRAYRGRRSFGLRRLPLVRVAKRPDF